MKQIITLFFLLTFFYSTAQDKKFTQNVITVTFLDPGISYEASLAKNVTAKFRTGITANYKKNTVVPDQQFAVFVRPMISVSGRYYYNFSQRMEKGKKINNNSANYFAFLGMYGFPSFIKNDPIYIIESSRLINAGVVWGLQRNYKNRFSLDFNIGVGYLGTPVTSNIGFIGEFTLGIWLGKKTE